MNVLMKGYDNLLILIEAVQVNASDDNVRLFVSMEQGVEIDIDPDTARQRLREWKPGTVLDLTDDTEPEIDDEPELVETGDHPRVRGTITTYLSDRGFGFAIDEDEVNHFVHISDCSGELEMTLEHVDKNCRIPVTFESLPPKSRGHYRQAAKVRLVEVNND